MALRLSFSQAPRVTTPNLGVRGLPFTSPNHTTPEHKPVDQMVSTRSSNRPAVANNVAPSEWQSSLRPRPGKPTASRRSSEESDYSFNSEPSRNIRRHLKRSLTPDPEDDSLPATPRRCYGLSKDRQQHEPIQLPLTPSSPFMVIRTARPQLKITNLPTEILQTIVEHFPNDSDVLHFALVCKITNSCTTPIIWRKRFIRIYDAMDNATTAEIVKEYAVRQGLTTKIALKFEEGDEKHRKTFLGMFKGMILQSNAKSVKDSQGNERIIGLNHERLRKYFTNEFGINGGSEFVQNIGKKNPNVASKTRKLGSAIKLCFLHLLFHPDMFMQKPARFHVSQDLAYQCRRDMPLFKGKNKDMLNVEWLLHVASFFKFHLKTPDGEGILTHRYVELEEKDLPKPWAGKIARGMTTQKLGSEWKGAFTFIHEDELSAFRNGTLQDPPIDETTEGNEGFQDLTLFFDLTTKDGKSDKVSYRDERLKYPKELDRYLEGPPAEGYKVNRNLVMPEVKEFFGLGMDARKYHLYGKVHAIPPQQGMPGFQRITMMKYLADSEGRYGIGRTAYWAYEGCVLPGNQIMLGRWWCPRTMETQERSYCGPFIFWNVQTPDKGNTLNNAIEFLNYVEEQSIW